MIGLDLGSSSIKVVLMQRGLKGPAIERCIEYPLAQTQAGHSSNGGAPPFHEALAAALQKAGVRSYLGRDLVVTSVPQKVIYTRLFRLPFTDLHQVAQTVPFEMEGQIPLDLEDVVVDYHPLQSARSNGPHGRDTTVLVAALPKTYLKNQIEEFQKAGVDPKAFEIDCLALYNFYQYYLKEVEGDMALLDIGASKTSLCLVGEGSPRTIRTVWFGGGHMTRAVAEGLNLSDEQAEQEKRRAALISSPTDGNEASEVIRECLRPFIHELTTTLHVYRTQFGRPIRRLYVCGGSAKLVGLAPYLARELGVEPVSGPGIPEEETFAVGIGLALKEWLGQRASRIRFRTGEFAYGKEQAEHRRRLTALSIGGAVLLLLAAGDISLRYHFKETRYQGLRSQVQATFQKTFPGVRTIVDEVEQTRAAQRELEKKAAFFGSGAVTALGLLQELTRRMPEDARIEVQEMVIEKDAIRIEARAASFEAVEKFKASLNGHEGFREVSITDAKTSADQSSVRFRIQIVLTEGI